MNEPDRKNILKLQKHENFTTIFAKDLSMSLNCLRILELPIGSDEIAVMGNLMLVERENMIKIFKFNSKMTLNLVNKFDLNFLSFASRYLTEDAKKLMFKITLNLIDKKTKFKEVETFVADLLDVLSFQNIKQVYFGNEKIYLKYNTNDYVILDSALNAYKIDRKQWKEYLSEEGVFHIKGSEKYTKITLKGVEILKKKLGKIKKYDISGDKIFLLKEDSILVISLN